MRVPSTVARALANYTGPEQHRARTMLCAMGWIATGERATPEEQTHAREQWRLDIETQEQAELL